jgi:hypothetical protein
MAFKMYLSETEGYDKISKYETGAKTASIKPLKPTGHVMHQQV